MRIPQGHSARGCPRPTYLTCRWITIGNLSEHLEAWYGRCSIQLVTSRTCHEVQLPLVCNAFGEQGIVYEPPFGPEGSNPALRARSTPAPCVALEQSVHTRPHSICVSRTSPCPGGLP